MRTGTGGPCDHCLRAQSPCWRKGPPEKPTLCNACGARYLVKRNLDGYMPGQKAFRSESPSRPATSKIRPMLSLFAAGGMPPSLFAHTEVEGKRKRKLSKRFADDALPLQLAALAAFDHSQLTSAPDSPTHRRTVIVRRDQHGKVSRGTQTTLLSGYEPACLQPAPLSNLLALSAAADVKTEDEVVSSAAVSALALLRSSDSSDSENKATMPFPVSRRRRKPLVSQRALF